jgi:hypothetical protein
MNLYEVTAFQNFIEKIAEENEGEIPEHLFQQLVEKETESIQQIEGLCKYLRNLELGVDMCTAEIKRILTMTNKAQKRMDSIKKYLLPYVAKHKKIEAGTFTLSTRKSESVNIIDKEKIPINYRTVIPETWNPDKKLIKDDIKKGVIVPGAELQEKDNLQIK